LFCRVCACSQARPPEITVTRDSALSRVGKLLALAAAGSGATEEDARSAAVAAARLMVEHHLLDPAASPTDIDEVAGLALRVMELEHMLVERQLAHAAELQRRDQQWRGILELVRREERTAARVERKRATKMAVTKDRTEKARAGGRARDRALDLERKKEIGRAGAAARWARWRERHEAEPR
jgi:hypothetical protein